MLKQVTFCLTFFVSVSLGLHRLPDKLYGPANVVINSFKVCSGPKAKDCAVIKIDLLGNNMMYSKVNVLETCSPSKGKVVGISNGKELARLHMNRPCDHPFLRPLFASLYNVTKNCQILKGNYERTVNIGQMIHKYIGGHFFYGHIMFRAHFYSDRCNFSCSIFNVTMTPKQ